MRTVGEYIEWVEALRQRIEDLKAELAAIKTRVDLGVVRSKESPDH